jgi:hypothetical protein
MMASSPKCSLTICMASDIDGAEKVFSRIGYPFASCVRAQSVRYDFKAPDIKPAPGF